jgi:hypothetical protein
MNESQEPQLLYSQDDTQIAKEDVPKILNLLNVKSCCPGVKVCKR